MNEINHPLNHVLRALWRVSGHGIDSLATCITLGGLDFTVNKAHGVFHHQDAEDYHELSLLEFKAAMRGLIGWERITHMTDRNRYDLRYVDALWQAYDLAHQAWMGEYVDWAGFRAKVVNPAVDDQTHHWNVRSRTWQQRSESNVRQATGAFTELRRTPLSTEALGVETE